MDDNYIIAMEIKSETYFGKGIFFFDLAFIVLFWFFMSNFEELLHPLMRLPYTIFNVAVAFFLTRKSSRNPEKRVYQSVLFRLLAQKDTVFHIRKKEPDGINYYDAM